MRCRPSGSLAEAVFAIDLGAVAVADPATPTVYRDPDAFFGGGFRQDVQVEHYDRAFAVVRTYTFTRAWPVGWRGATLDADQSRVALEELHLAYDRVTMVPGAGG